MQAQLAVDEAKTEFPAIPENPAKLLEFMTEAA